MESDKAKSNHKELKKVLKATGIGAVVGGATLPYETFRNIGWGDYSPINNAAGSINDNFIGYKSFVPSSADVKLKAAAANSVLGGLGGLAAYGVIKGLQKLNEAFPTHNKVSLEFKGNKE